MSDDDLMARIDEIAEGKDPSNEKKIQRATAKIGEANTFKAVADEYIAKCKAEGKADELTLQSWNKCS